MLLFVTNLCFTIGFLWHIDNLLSERKELWCEIFPLFSNYSSDCCTSHFFKVQAVDFINILLKEQVYLCTVDFLPAFYNVVHKEYYDYRSTLSHGVNKCIHNLF